MRLFQAFTLLSLCLSAMFGPASSHAERKLNVVVIIVDTLGARHLGSHDSTLKNSPRLDELARTGAHFTQAYSTSSWTKPSIASILTSKMPSRHGVIGPVKKLPLEASSLPELFQNDGYKTIGIVSHTFLGKNSGFQQGFDEYYQLNNTKKVHSLLTSNLVSDQAIESINRRTVEDKNGNFFMLLHYFDPHFRYQHHQEFDQTSGYKGSLKSGMTLEKLERAKSKMSPEDIQYLVGLHREEIAYTDKHIGRVIDHLKTKGLQKNTLVIVTADHGEGFMEHGYLGHTVSLYEELVHVPLIFNLPGVVVPGEYSVPVSILDVAPSAAALSGRTPENGWEGRSLAQSLFGKAQPPNRNIFMEVSYLSHERAINPNILAVRSGDRKVIHDLNRNRWSLFDIGKDPKEQSNLAASNADELKLLGGSLDELKKLHAEMRRAPVAPGQEIEMQADEVKKLKSLGYL